MPGLINPAPDKDRVYSYEYNARGDKITEKLFNVETQDIIKGADGKPSLKNIKHDYLEKQFRYTGTQKLSKVIHEDKTEENYFYDERDICTAFTGVTRTVKDEDGNEIKATPLTTFLPDAFGDIVVTQTSDKTAKLTNEDKPIFSAPDRVFETISLKDNRGLIIAKQDGNGNVTRFTHTASRKLASETKQTTAWKKDGASFSQIKHQDKNLYDYDTSGRRNAHFIERDGQLIESTFYTHNIFGDQLGEGGKEGNQDAYVKVDASGHPWFSNADKGGYSIKLRDLVGRETLQIQSPTIDLSQFELANLNELLSKDHSEVELTELTRDLLGHVISTRIPIWYRNAHKDKPPTHAYQFDRWDNLIQEWDSQKNVTTNIYDKRNLLTVQYKPNVDVLNDQLIAANLRPKTEFGYNLCGFNIGISDAKNHTTGFLLDAAGQINTKLMADGSIGESLERDVLSRPLRIYDARHKKTAYTYDAMNNVTTLTLPSGNKYRYEYDEYNNRNLTIDPRGAFNRANFDPRSNCITQFTHSGYQTDMEYDRNHQLLKKLVPDQSPLTWVRDWFGNVRDHDDLSGVHHHDGYNYKMQLSTEETWGGYQRQHVSVHHNTNLKSTTIDYKNDVPKQSIKYEYAYGLLALILDYAKQQKTEYECNDDARRYRMRVSELAQTDPEIFLRRITTKWDALGRDVDTLDEYRTINQSIAKAHVETEYDAVDNRMHRKLSITQPRYHSACPDAIQRHDSYYKYDELDRTLIVSGIRNGNAVVLGAGQGMGFTYHQGFRKTERTFTGEGTLFNTNIDFNDDGALWRYQTNTGVRDTRLYYPNGILNWHERVYEYKLPGPMPKWPDYATNWRKESTYDLNNWSTEERYYDNFLAGHMPDHLFSRTTNKNQANGTIHQSTTLMNVKRHTTVDNMEYYYNGVDVPQLTVVSGQRERNGRHTNKTHACLWHDENMRINAKILSTDEPNENVTHDELVERSEEKETDAERRRERDRLREKEFNQLIHFDTTTEGMVLGKEFLKWDQAFQPHSTAQPLKTYIPYYNVNGIPQGVFLSRFDCNKETEDGYCHGIGDRRGKLYQEWPVETAHQLYNHIPAISVYYPDEQDKNNPLWGPYVMYTPPVSPIYFTQTGDTLESIAEQQYGDSQYAYDIAKTNGLLINRRLTAGQVLYLPQIVPAQNKATHGKSFEALAGLLTGTLSPYLAHA